MQHIDPIHIGDDAAERLVDYCKVHASPTYVVVGDSNTFEAFGNQVVERLKAAELNVLAVTLRGADVVADAHYLLDVFLELPEGAVLFIAVGAGTITDITRFVSHRSSNPFVAVPTAASVDGYTSVGAPLVVRGMKTTYKAQAPGAIFADPDVLSRAPDELTAAGFADMTAKYSSLADWELGALIWNERFDEEAAELTRHALDSCVEASNGIAARDPRSLEVLINGLFESGMAIMRFGRSHPASGSEHHFSHFLEMQLLQMGEGAVLHGAKVALGTLASLSLWDRVRTLTQADVKEMVARSKLPSREEDERAIQDGYGPAADSVTSGHEPFLGMTSAQIDEIREKIVYGWQEILNIAAKVPQRSEVEALFEKVGTPTTGSELGFTQQDQVRAQTYGHFLRNRFTVVKLSRFLGV